MVRLCDEALKSSKRFAVPEGLGGAGVHVADPAMGSGTFLLGVMRRIAEGIAEDQGAGAVGPAMTAVAERLIGFELQFGAFAVAQLRMLAEMIELGATGSPRLFVTNTLGDPYADQESGTGIYRELSRSRREANAIKRSQPITVVIGNPPYKEKAKGRGSWIEQGSGNRRAPLADWQAPAAWGVGAHAKHLRNLYVYFWRWAAWKVFEQGAGGRDLEPPVAERRSGLVCYITVSGFLNGPGFQKMRHDLRRDCDEVCVIDCSPEGHQPEVATRIFQDVQHPVCIVLASRSPANDPKVPARVRYRSLAPGRREAKFVELADVALDGAGWLKGASGWRAPFLPEFNGGWGDMVPLDMVIGDSGSGVMPGRTWVIAPDAGSLHQRWDRLIGEKNRDRRAMLFHPHLRDGIPGDRHVAKAGAKLIGGNSVESVEWGLAEQQSKDAGNRSRAQDAVGLTAPVRYGFRSFDRQWIIPDTPIGRRARSPVRCSASWTEWMLSSSVAPRVGGSRTRPTPARTSPTRGTTTRQSRRRSTIGWELRVPISRPRPGSPTPPSSSTYSRRGSVVISLRPLSRDDAAFRDRTSRSLRKRTVLSAGFWTPHIEDRPHGRRSGKAALKSSSPVRCATGFVLMYSVLASRSPRDPSYASTLEPM